MYFIYSASFCQQNNLPGIYQVDWGYYGSKRYLILNCDSTYRFITHWDFGTEDNIEPPISENIKWRVDKNNRVTLEKPTLDYKSFNVLPNGNLTDKKRSKPALLKIAAFTTECSLSYFIFNYSSDNYTIVKLLPGLKMNVAEVYTEQKLMKRTTYYALTDEDYEKQIGNIKISNTGIKDYIMEIRRKLTIY